MEIEKKYIIKEKEKTFPCPFPIEKLKKEIKDKGLRITQHYLPIEFIEDVSKELNLRINFKPNEIRLRKFGTKYFVTIKSSGDKKRFELEKRITKEIFDRYSLVKEKTLEKQRLIKEYKKKKIEFDYYRKYSLITAEIEFRNIREADSFKSEMKEITGLEKYKNQNLAI